jgi:histidinol phosphatase-like PHP family hydrolase
MSGCVQTRCDQVRILVVKTLPFDKPGQFYRGNLHTHSTLSDGARSPEQVITDYRSRGYDFISLTDHFLPQAHFRKGQPGFIGISDTRHLDCNEFVTILGAEIHAHAMENGELWHMVAVGLPLDFPEWNKVETGPEIAQRAADAGAFVSLAHPHWNAVSENDALAVAPIVHSVEIYNHASEVGVKRGYGLHQADVLLAKGHRVTFNAADDAHFKHPEGMFVDGFGGWVQVKAETLSPDALLAALKRGEFYSSQGPELHNVEIVEGTVRVACSPVESIVVSGRGATYSRVHGASLIEAEVPLPGAKAGKTTPYVRVTVVDRDGRSAWTNPIWLDG